MTFEQLGSVGEVVGALATVATLLYLATQIRQNTTTVRSAATASYTQSIHNVSNLLASDAELCELYFQGLEDPSALTVSQRRRFVIVLGTFVTHLAQSDEMEEAGTLSRELADQYNAQLDWLVGQPGFRAWHEMWGATLPKRFSAKVERATARASASGLLGTFREAPGAKAPRGEGRDV